MANTIDRELFDRLRASGLRKRVARVISEATGAGRDAGGRAEQTARKAIKDLRGLADEIEDRLRGTTQKSSRSEAAKKGAQTRARQASTRSEAAKKAARTRAAKATSGSSRSSGGTTRAKATSGSSRSSGATKRASSARSSGGTSRASGGTSRASGGTTARKPSSSS